MPPPDANATPAARWYFLDWLRIAAFGLLVPYHVGMYYVRWPYLVKSPFANAGPEPWMLLTNPWRMSLLFIISGAVSSLVLQRRQGAGFMAERSRRLLLPLLCGMALIVPPQAYYEVVHKFAYAGSYADFLHLYFAGFKGFCQSGRCVALPTWNHLWFLPYVWCYALLLWLLLRLRPTSLDSLAHRCRWLLHGARLLWVPVLVIVLMRWTLYRRFPATYDLVHDGFWYPMYGLMFLGGAVLVRMPDVWAQFARWRWPALGLALLAWAVFLTQTLHGLGGGQRGVAGVQQWCALVAVLGFGYAHLNRDHPWRAYLNQAVFPVYLFHQTCIVLLSQWLLPLAWRPALEAPVLIAATFALSLLAYEMARRLGPLRPWFGLNRSPR